MGQTPQLTHFQFDPFERRCRPYEEVKICIVRRGEKLVEVRAGELLGTLGAGREVKQRIIDVQYL